MSDHELESHSLTTEAFEDELGGNASLEVMRYDDFFRRRGMRKVQSFTSPTFFPLDTFELPLGAVIHHIPDNDVELGILPSHFFLRKAGGMILAEHVTSTVTTEGSPIKVPVDPGQLINKYRKANRRIRILQKYDTAFRDPKVICIINYSMLNHVVRYRRARRARLFKYENLMHTVVSKINSISAITDRQQYIELTVPKILPTKSHFVRATASDSIRVMDAFPDERSLTLLELWKWLGPERETSIFSELTIDSIKALNFVWQESGRYCFMNLGLIDSWRKGPDGGDIDPKQLQLRFLRFLSAVFDIKTVSAKTTIDVKVDEKGEESVDAIVDDGEELEDLIKEEKKAHDEFVAEEVIAEDDEIDEDEVIGTQFVTRDDYEDEPNPPSDPATLTESIVAEADVQLETGMISPAEHRRFSRLANKFEELPDPYGESGSLLEVMKVDKEVVSVLKDEITGDIPTAIDKSHLKSTLQNFDKEYITKVMRADITNTVMSVSKAAVAVTDYKVEKVIDANSRFEIHSVKLVPVKGAPSTLRFTMPIVNERGEYMDRGTKYRMRKQRADMPIRKIAADRVALTTYYSKLSVARSDRRVDDYGKWLLAQVNLLVDSGELTKPGYGQVFNQALSTPRAFSALATFYTHFEYKGNKFIWDYAQLVEEFSKKTINASMRDGEVICGRDSQGRTLIMDHSDIISVKGTDIILGTLEELLPMEANKAPVEIATLELMTKKLPMGLVLSYYFGFSKLMRKLKVPHRKVRRGSPLELQPDEFMVRFKDLTLIMPRSEKLAGLVFGSLNAYKNSVVQYNFDEYDSQDVFAAVLDVEGLGIRYFRELKLLKNMYIDPISRELLEEMGEPTEFPELLLRATSLLTTDEHPDKSDAKLRRIRGYERMSGHLYTQIVAGLRTHAAGENNPKSTVDINPIAVQAKINQDPAVTLVDEINPVQNLKEVENLTFGGTGGRSGRTMVRNTRAFHKSEIGLISEGTVDSQDVGVTTFLPPNPKIKSLRGVTEDWEYDPKETSSLASTSSLLSPCSDGDDPKRRNFIGIQHSHVVATVGYTASPLMTGYEDVIAQRSGPLFSYVAHSPGVIKELVPDSHVTIEYKDEDTPTDVFELGTVYGKSGKYRIPHKLVSDVKLGSKVNKGDVIAYNTGFFSRSILAPKQVTWKTGVITKLAFMDVPDTLEDSMALAPILADQLVMNEAHEREITLRFDQVIRNLVTVGEKVDFDSILCNIEEAATSQADAFDQEVMDSLKVLAQNSPTAKSAGTVTKVEIIYHGDLDDMNDGLRDIVTKADKKRAKRAKLLKDEVLTGEVADLDMDTVIIRVTIEGNHGMGDGDKLVVSNQLKCTVSRIMVGENTDAHGNPLGGIFGYQSVSDRIVTSLEKAATTITLIRLNNKRAAAAYRNAK